MLTLSEVDVDGALRMFPWQALRLGLDESEMRFLLINLELR